MSRSTGRARRCARRSGAGKIGTTGKGIGPAYEDKVARRALRVQDLKHPERFAEQAARAARAAQLRARRLSRAARALEFEPIFEHGDEGRPSSCEPMIGRRRLRAPQAAPARRQHPVRGRAGHAARHRPRHLSVRHLEQLRRRQRRGRLGRRARTSCTTSSASPRPTPRASAAGRSRPSCRSTSPARSATTCRPSARSAARSPAGRAAAAGSMRRRSSARSSSTASRACASPSSTCSTAWPRSRSASATSCSGERIDILPLDADDIVACEPIYETFPGWSESTVGVTEWERLAAQRAPLPRAGAGASSARRSTWCRPGPTAMHTILLRHPYQRADAAPPRRQALDRPHERCSPTTANTSTSPGTSTTC